MRTLNVTVPFPRGFHARPAARFVRLLSRFRSRVFLRCGSRVASASSLFSILLLSATVNTQLEIQAAGEDEDEAIQAAEVFFQNDDEARAPHVQVSAPRGAPSENAG